MRNSKIKEIIKNLEENWRLLQEFLLSSRELMKEIKFRRDVIDARLANYNLQFQASIGKSNKNITDKFEDRLICDLLGIEMPMSKRLRLLKEAKSRGFFDKGSYFKIDGKSFAIDLDKITMCTIEGDRLVAYANGVLGNMENSIEILYDNGIWVEVNKK